MYRAFWSAVHGFVSIEATGVMALPVDRAESFRRTVEVFADELSRTTVNQQDQPQGVTSSR
jgi:hypothetical protein